MVARVRGPAAAALAPERPLTTAALTLPPELVEPPEVVVPPLPEPLPPLPEPELPAPTVPVVVVVAVEPELETEADAVEFGDASALDAPVIAALVIW